MPPVPMALSEATTDPTSPNAILSRRPVHGHRTRANPHPIGEGPLPTVWEEPNQTQPKPAPTHGPHSPWPTRTVEGEKIGGKKNSVRHASLKRVQKLIDERKRQDGEQIAQQEVSARAQRAKRRE